MAQTYAEERNIRFIVRRKEIVNLPTFVDYNRLEQAVLNVISNAVKFSYINGIVEIDLVSKMIGDDKVEYTLTVQDHGIGMSKEFQATMFEAYTRTFDAILMDLRMPVMDGFTASRKIRNSGKEDADKIPIIAVTANFYDDNKQASKEAGMDSILSKPVDPKILIGELKRYICK